MDALRRRIVDDFEKGAGRHDDPDVYGGPPGDPGLIGPGSMSWEINADLASVSQAGLPAIVLEILHPSVIAGVQDLSNYREDPFQRARATLGYVLTTTFGNTEAATAVIERVKHVHSFVNGTRPDGVPYRALDPELIAWVHTCIPWMILRAYEHTKRPLSQQEQDRYLAEQAVIGRMGGADWVPDDRRRTRRLRRGDAARAQRQRADPGVHRLPDDLAVLPRPARAGRSPAAPVRDLRGNEPRTAVGARAHRLRPAVRGDARADRARMLRLDARRLRWAFGTPRYVQLARERAAGAVRPKVAARDRRASSSRWSAAPRAGGRVDEAADRTSQRILDAALQEAAAVGLQRITVEDVVRRAGVSRMTAYRRYPRRDDLVEALVRRETQRFLAAVADAIDAVEDPQRGRGRGVHRRGLVRPRASDAAPGRTARAGPDRRLRRAADDGIGVHRQLHSRRRAGRTVAAGALGRRRVRPAVLHLHLDAADRSRLRRRRRTAPVRARGPDADGGARRRLA